MRLRDLFEDDAYGEDEIRSYIYDLLLPLYDSGVPFVSIQSLQDQIAELDLGMDVDKDYIMYVASPDKIKIIKKIEDDKIYLDLPHDDGRSLSNDQEEKQQKNFEKTVSNQASKELKK